MRSEKWEVRSLNGWYGGGEYGERAARTPCALRAVMAHSSPEPAAGLFGGDEGLWGGGDCWLGGREYGASRSRACTENDLFGEGVCGEVANRLLCPGRIPAGGWWCLWSQESQFEAGLFEVLEIVVEGDELRPVADGEGGEVGVHPDLG